MNSAERKYLNKVAQLPCLICKKLGYPGDDGVEIHHIRGVGLGLGVRNSHYNVLPLCVFHHRGNDGYHGLGRKAFERQYEVTEAELLQQVESLLTPEVTPEVPLK